MEDCVFAHRTSSLALDSIIIINTLGHRMPQGGVNVHNSVIVGRGGVNDKQIKQS